MNISDKNKFLVIISGLATEFGGKAQKDNVKLRFDALMEYSIEDISKAATWLVKNRTEKYPPIPTTREIIAAIEIITGNLESKTVAGIQADIVFKKLREWGKEAEPLFLNKTTLYLMTHRWSFAQLGNMGADDLKWFRKEFISSFIDMDKQEVAPLIESSIKKALPDFKMKKIE